MVKAKQLPTKIRTQQQQYQQQENQLQHTKSKAKSKKNQRSIMELIRRPNVITVIKAKPSLTKARIISKKRKQTKQIQEPIRRSLLMTNALLPLMPTKTNKNQKNFNGGQQKIGSTAIGRSRVSASEKQTLFVARDSLERVERSKKQARNTLRRYLESSTVGKSEKATAHQAVGKETFYDKGQRLGPMPLKHSTRPHLSGPGGREEGGGTSTACVKHSNQNSHSHSNQKNNDMEVPLTTRLPIIDFISTDDFARMHASKKQKAARRLALAKEANE